MKRISKAIFGAILTIASITAFADVSSVKKKLATSKFIRVDLQKNEVAETLIQGIYRITENNAPESSYLVDENVTFVMMMTGLNPGESGFYRLAAPNFSKHPMPVDETIVIKRNALKNLDTSKLIKLKYGNGKQKIFLASALDCPGCLSLEKRLEKMRPSLNATVFIIPTIQEPTNESYELLHRVMCSSDSSKAWSDAMLRRKAPEPVSNGCKLSFVDGFAVAGMLGGLATPAFFNDDAMRIYPSGMTDADLRVLLNPK